MSSRADIRRAMRQARCGRCGRKPRDMPDFAQWNHSYVNGRLVEVICADCQTPDEAEEAVHNAASGKSDGMTKAFDCRMMTADELRAYIQTVPDDGERLTGKWRWGRDRLSGMGRSDWSSVQAAIASLSVTVWPRRWS